MGTFVKAFVVDGQEYELYAQIDEQGTSYDIVQGAKVIWSGLVKPPDEETVIGLVRAVRGRKAGAA